MTLLDDDSLPFRGWDTIPTPIQLALARGHRWLFMLESGEVSSVKEIARRERVDDSYVSPMVNPITFATDIVAAILDDTLPPGGHAFRAGGRDVGAVGGAVGESRPGSIQLKVGYPISESV